MAGNFINVSNSKDADLIGGAGGSQRTDWLGAKSTVFYNESLDGEPRRSNLFATRLLGQTMYVEMMKDIIKNQVASTDFVIRPKFDEDREPTDRELEAARSMERFFDGNFNSDSQSFNQLKEELLDDILDMNSGVIELKPDSEGYVDEIRARDGLTFTKNVDASGALPEPDSGEAAYYQFSLSAHARNYFGGSDGIDLRNIKDELYLFPYEIFNRETRGFPRDRIVWFQEDGRTYNIYGRGRTQKIKKGAEVLLNGDIHRNRFFKDNEFHKGVLQIANASQKEIDALEEKIDSTKGDEHELPIVGGTEADFIQIDPTPEKMQFLESHKWYTKLVLMAYGLNESEAGNHENANLSVSDEMKFNVFRRTTSPLLNMMAKKFTNQVLPFMREYHAVECDFEMVPKPENRFLEQMENELLEQEINSGLRTLNEARKQKGRETFGPVGDLPQFVVDKLTSQVPGYTAEQMSDELEDVPASEQQPEGLLQMIQDSDDDDGDDHDKGGDGPDGGGGTGNPNEASRMMINSFREAFEQADRVLEDTRDALRNDRSNEFPPLKSEVDKFSEEVGDQFTAFEDDVINVIENEFPEEDTDNSLLMNADSMVQEVDLRDTLQETVEENNLEILEKSGEFHASKLEAEIEDRFNVPGDVKISLDFNLLDTFAAEKLRQEALRVATQVNDTIKKRLKKELLDGMEEGIGADKMKRRIRDKFDSLDDNHAEVVARTETLSSSRSGSQALAESSDVVAGKEWIKTDDNRTRTWHDVMGGTVVDKDEAFEVPKIPKGQQKEDEYQPKDYPRTAFVVGEDQPYNCRCAQAPVVDEDMAENRSLKDFAEQFDAVKLETDLRDRQLEVYLENAEDGETFKDMMTRIIEEKDSKEAAAEALSIGKATLYDWVDE